MSELRQSVKGLLDRGEVDVVLAWRLDPESGQVKPHMFRKSDRIEELVFDERCVHNLVTFLSNAAARFRKVGIVVKGCDGRALATLLIEKHLARDRFHAIAVACDGVKVNGRDAAKCADCATNVSPIADTTIGTKQPARQPEYRQLEYLEKMGPQERWQFVEQQFSRCQRCYSCRQVCPMCYCETCIAEQSEPAWVDPTNKLSGNVMWQLARAYHLAGRCADCGECERACPERIPLRLLNAALEKAVGEMFGARPGTVPDAQPVLLAPSQADTDAMMEAKQ